MKTYTKCTSFDKAMEMVNQTRKYPEYVEIIRKYLLQHPDEINKSKYGDTALTSAAQYSNKFSTEKTVQILIDAKADLNERNMFGDTALILAAQYSNNTSTEKTVQMLIDAKADLNLQNYFGYTALILAAQNSNKTSSEKTVQMLIDAKADLNIQNEFGYTALMKAAQFSNNYSTEKTVQMIIDAGAKYKYCTNINANILQLKYDGLFFLDIPNDKQIEYYDTSIKSYPHLLKHLYARNVSQIIQILPFVCQFYHYQSNKIMIDVFMAIKN